MSELPSNFAHSSSNYVDSDVELSDAEALNSYTSSDPTQNADKDIIIQSSSSMLSTNNISNPEIEDDEVEIQARHLRDDETLSDDDGFYDENDFEEEVHFDPHEEELSEEAADYHHSNDDDEYENDLEDHSNHRHNEWNENDEDDYDQHTDDDADIENRFTHSDALRMLTSALGNGNSNSRLSELEEFFSNRLDTSTSENPRNNNLQDNQHSARLNGNGLLFNSFVSQLLSSSNSRIVGLIDGLDSHDHAYLVMETLNEISSTLLMMSSLQSERQVPTQRLSTALVRVINQYPDDMELQLVACRCIYNLAEVNYNLMYEIVSSGVIECLNSKLLDISYIDLAEQALQALEIISRKAGRQCLTKGSVPIVLTYLDFFTVHAQRKALLIAANASAFINKKSYTDIETVFPTIKNVATSYSDPQCVESAWKFISNTIKLYTSTPSLLQNLVDVDFIVKLCDIFPVCLGDGKKSSGLVTFKTCISLLDSLALVALNSPKFSNDFVCECKISQLITKIFLSYQSKDSNEQNVTIETLTNIPKELLIVLLKFMAALIPINQQFLDQFKDLDIGNYAQLDADGITINHEKIEFSILNIDAYSEFYTTIFPLLLSIYDSTVEYKVRRLVYVVLSRTVWMMSPPQLEKVIQSSSIISTLASTISQGKSVLSLSKGGSSKQQESKKLYSLICGSLLVTHSLVIGNPTIFLPRFVKEGLISQIDELSLLLQAETNTIKSSETTSSAINNENPSRMDLGNNKRHVAAASHDSHYSDEYSDVDSNNDDDIDEDEDDEMHDSDRNNNSRDSNKKDLILYDGLFTLTQDLIICRLQTICGYIIDNCHLLMSQNNINASENIEALNKFNSKLNVGSSQLSYDESVALWKGLVGILNPQKASKSISSFELISSGIVKQLLSTFEKEINLNSPLCKAFQNVFCSSLSEYIDDKTSPLVLLVKKLEEAVDRNESFDIVCMDTDVAQNARSRAASMTKQMKLKLVPLESDVGTPPKSVMLVVHAIATFETIQKFIKESKSINLRTNFNLNSSSIDNDYHYVFYLDGNAIPSDSTIFGAVYKASVDDDNGTDASKESLLRTTHVIKYKAVAGKLPTEDKSVNNDLNVSSLDSFADENVLEILQLLRILYELNCTVINPISSDVLFINYKLSAKLKRQLDEPLLVASGILPDWAIIVPREFSFLFPLETRLFFLRSTSFGYSRLVDYWLARSKDESSGAASSGFGDRIPLLGRSMRHKLRISRERLFSSAIKVMETYATNPGLLEIEFFDEVGSGLGPTLEFYSNVSKDFGKLKLYMWRSDQYDMLTKKKIDVETIIHDKHGLFPRPLYKSHPHYNNSLLYFKVLGKFLARAFLDSRLVDFHFNPLFFEICMKYTLENNIKLTTVESISKIKELDESLASSMTHLNQYLDDFKNLPQEEWKAHTVSGASVGELMLSFVLPGYEEIKLIPGGDEIYVDETNLSDYMEKLIDFILNDGIIEQVKSFVEGFSEIFPFSSLRLFSADELARLSGTEVENWSVEMLISVVHADHGYTGKSQQITWLVDIMAGFDKEERRKFLKFITGSPRLPYDGFKGLSPPFTVVLKHSEGNLKPDDYLPSVMTCANYLKLPQYSTYEIMRAKIIHAMNEGNDSFLLS